MFHNRQILASNNKTKKLWNIIKTETNRKGKTEDNFGSAVVMSRYFKFLQQFFPFNS